MKKVHSAYCGLQLTVYSFLLFSLFTFYFSLLTPSYASTVDDLIQQIQKKYNDIQQLQGRFSQISYIKELDRVERYEGRFFISRSRGAKIRLIYTKPLDEEVIINNTSIWVYKKSVKQAFRGKFTRDSYGQLPIFILQRLGDLRADFNITPSGENTLELRPRSQIGLIKKIRLAISSGDFPVNSLTIFDVYGNKTDIVIKDIEINPGLDESLFVFTPSKGVEIFELNH